MQSSEPVGESSSTQPWRQDSGTLEDAEAAEPGCEIRGDPELHRRRSQRERIRGNLEIPLETPDRLEAPGRLGAKLPERRRVRDPGQLGGASDDAAEGAGIRGNLETHLRQSRKIGIWGNLETDREARLEEQRFGATRRRAHRDRRRMRDSRKLEAPSPAQLEDAGSGETRGPIRRLDGTIDGSVTSSTP